MQRSYEAELGLREQIAKAESATECGRLLLIGVAYLGASKKTQRAWRATAKRRQAQLNGGAK
jgi:hypothetical protein